MVQRGRAAGFTLIELMVALVVAAIIASMAVPGFRDMIQNNRAATQSNELVTAFSLARSEAVKRGARVSVCPTTDQASCTDNTDWAVGWMVFVDLAANDGAGPVVQLPPLRAWDALRGNATLRGPTLVRFRPLGDVTAPAAFQHRVPGCVGDQGRDINVNMAGRPAVMRVPC
ncbi:MAG: GspH/FimT family pseudopilin [Chromatiales bacterium]|nr:GspH/FimT family pseudopilin [Chromatiales bacterium]